MIQERTPIPEQNGWTPISRYIDGKLLKELGLSGEPTYSMRRFIGNGGALEKTEIAFFVAKREVRENTLSENGHPVIICKKGSTTDWYLVGVDGKHPNESSPGERRDFFTNAEQITDRKDPLFGPWILEHFAEELVKSLIK